MVSLLLFEVRELIQVFSETLNKSRSREGCHVPQSETRRVNLALFLQILYLSYAFGE